MRRSNREHDFPAAAPHSFAVQADKKSPRTVASFRARVLILFGLGESPYSPEAVDSSAVSGVAAFRVSFV